MLDIIVFYIRSIFEKKNWKLYKVFLFIIGVFLITIFSGVSYTTFGMNSRLKIILYIVSFLFFGSLFFLNLDVKVIKKIKELKRTPIPSYYTIAYILMVFLSVLSFLFNPQKALNLNTYIAFWLTISITYFVLNRFSAKFIMKTYKNTVFLLTILSSILFIYTYFSKTFFSFSYFSTNNRLFGISILNTDFISGLSYSLNWNLRFSSIFWEPSVFGVVLILALICDFFSKDDLTLYRFIVFTIAILLTKSTAAFIVYGLFITFIIYKQLENHSRAQFIFILTIFLAILIFMMFSRQIIEVLAKAMPSVFGKFIDSSSLISFTTRFQSLPIFFKVFLKNPIFGLGGVSSGEAYFNLAGDSIDAQTSTIGKVISSFGMAGIVYVLAILGGIILNDKISNSDKLFLILFFLLLSNVQGQIEILIINIIYFLPLVYVKLPDKAIQKNECFLVNDDDRKLGDILFAKTDDGELSSNIIYSLGIKGLSIVIAFLTIPSYLHYFNQDESMYGVWLVITSVLSIITVFDFGMGNGLKNKLIKNISEKKYNLSRIYISTTYLFTLLIGFLIFISLSIFIFTISDDTIVKIFFPNQFLMSVDIISFRIAFSVIMLAIGLNFGFKNINYILQAHQKNAITSSFMLFTNVTLLLFVTIFANIIPMEKKIIALSIIYNIFLNLPLFLISIILFARQYKHLRPSVKLIDFHKSKEVINIGFKFFIVQFGTLFMWSTNELIILLVFKNPSYVTEYTIYYKLFSLLPIILGTVIQQPIWTSISKADAEGDFIRIKRYSIVLFAITFLFLVLNLILTAILPFVFNLWLGLNSPDVTIAKSVTFIIYSLIYLLTMAIVIICNALSLFKAQIITAIITIVFKIPLLLLLTKTKIFNNIGWEVIILINMLCYLPVVIYAPFEIKRDLDNKLKNGFLTKDYNYSKHNEELIV